MKWYIINIFSYSGNNGQKNGGTRALMEVVQANYGLKNPGFWKTLEEKAQKNCANYERKPPLLMIEILICSQLPECQLRPETKCREIEIKLP
jgi:hypothetical protein